MTSSKMFTVLCIGLFLIAAAFANPSKCPSIETIGCVDDPLPCQSPLPVELQSTLTLEDGTVCPACKHCSASDNECPPLPCPMIQLPPGCSQKKFYHLTIQLERQTCWACDYLRCLYDGENE